MKQYNIVIIITLAIIVGTLLSYLLDVILFINPNVIIKIVFIYILSAFLLYRIQKKASFYMPSFYLFCHFTIAAIIGMLNYYYSYVKLYGDYLGVNLDMKHALYIWVQGLLFVMLGISLIHIIKNKILKKYRLRKIFFISWNWKIYSFIFIILTIVSIAFTIVSVNKIGYIPILKGNIDVERFRYFEIVGDWPMKLSRFWILIYFFVFIKLLRNIKLDKAFYIRKNIYLLLLLLCSFFISAIYGERFAQFAMIVFSIIMINKAIGRIKIWYIVLLFLAGTLFFIGVNYVRSKTYKYVGGTFIENLLINIYSEFCSFAYAIQEYPESKFLYGKTFIATIAPIFPKQVWRGFFNINKEELMKGSSASVMKEIFGHYAGIRIGIIGIGYINFGYWGTVFVPFLSGVLFGILENIFTSLKLFDVKEIIVVFALSLLMFLPVIQTNQFANVFMFYMYFIMLFIIIFHKKYFLINKKNKNII